LSNSAGQFGKIPQLAMAKFSKFHGSLRPFVFEQTELYPV